MAYHIDNTLLPIGQIYGILSDSIDMFLAGESLAETPFIEWGRKRLRDGTWWYGCENPKVKDQEKCIRLRQMKVIKLFGSLENEGYKGSLIHVFFDGDGFIHTYDGFHRLNLMKKLGMKVKVNVVISTRDKDPERRGDFPLAETLEEINSGKHLYQPVNDVRVNHFLIWRHECEARLEFILKHLCLGETVLDIGCETGWFSRELAKLGFYVTAVEKEQRRIAVARYLATINSLDIKHFNMKWQLHLKVVDVKKKIWYDNALFLSVFHHDILGNGVEKAFKMLETFRGKVGRLFFECPSSSGDVKWLKSKDHRKYHFTEPLFKKAIEEATELKIVDEWKGVRYIYVLEASS